MDFATNFTCTACGGEVDPPTGAVYVSAEDIRRVHTNHRTVEEPRTSKAASPC